MIWIYSNESSITLIAENTETERKLGMLNIHSKNTSLKTHKISVTLRN